MVCTGFKARLAQLIIPVLVIGGCSAESEEQAIQTEQKSRAPSESTAVEASAQNAEPVDPSVMADPDTGEPKSANDFVTTTALVETTSPAASSSTETAIVDDGPPAEDATTTSMGMPDVGYEGLARSINNLERNLTPYFSDPTARISPEVAARLKQQTANYVSEIKNAQSVDKELRMELRERAVDIHLAVDEMAKSPSTERYNELRAAAQQRVEQIQANLLDQDPQSQPE